MVIELENDNEYKRRGIKHKKKLFREARRTIIQFCAFQTITRR